MMQEYKPKDYPIGDAFIAGYLAGHKGSAEYDNCMEALALYEETIKILNEDVAI